MTKWTASLGMYDLPALREANDALWLGVSGWLQDKGIEDVPQHLDRERPLAEIWDDPGLLLAHTCGLPLATRWRDRLRYVATPIYDVPGCEGPRYRSVLVVAHDNSARKLDDLRGAIVAINEPLSNSGCNLLAAAVEALASIDGQNPFFSAAIMTGSHLASAQAVARGDATVAAIDIITYAHLRSHHAGLTKHLRTIGCTPSAPGLPIVTSTKTADTLLAILQQGLEWATHASELQTARQVLRLRGFAQVPLAQYTSLGTLTTTDAHAIPAALARHVRPV